MSKKANEKTLRQPFDDYNAEQLSKHDLGTIDTYLSIASRDFALTHSLVRNLHFCL